MRAIGHPAEMVRIPQTAVVPAEQCVHHGDRALAELMSAHLRQRLNPFNHFEVIDEADAA